MTAATFELKLPLRDGRPKRYLLPNTTGEIATGAAGATVAGFTETEFKVASIGGVGKLIKITAF